MRFIISPFPTINNPKRSKQGKLLDGRDILADRFCRVRGTTARTPRHGSTSYVPHFLRSSFTQLKQEIIHEQIRTTNLRLVLVLTVHVNRSKQPLNKNVCFTFEVAGVESANGRSVLGTVANPGELERQLISLSTRLTGYPSPRMLLDLLVF